MHSPRCILAAILISALARNGLAWKTDGTLPAKSQFATYAGKFCFDYVPLDSAAERTAEEASRDLTRSCDLNLITQTSSHACVFGKSFGCREDTVGSMWVAQGCRGDFTLNGSPLTCDSWNENSVTCATSSVPTSGYLEVEVRGQMIEGPGDDPTQGHMFLMLFDDESEHWARAKANWNELSCEQMHGLADGAFPLSSELIAAPYNAYQIIRIQEKLRPRFWHFAFVNCGAKNVLVPLTYTLHARNIRQGSDAEFGIDAYKSVPLELFFGIVFGAITLCALSLTWKRLPSRPLLFLLCASAACSAAGCCLLAVHHKVYASNGRGFIPAGALGMFCVCVSKALFIVLQFLIAKGWALFFAPEDRSQLLVVIATLIGIAGISVGCEVHGWLVEDSSIDLYLYESWPGIVILCLNLSLLVVAWLMTWKNLRQEKSVEVRRFYLRVSLAAAISFASLPLVCVLTRLLVPWVRQRYTERVELLARFVSSGMLLILLWPTQLDFTIGARMKGRVGSLAEDDEDLPDICSVQQRHDFGTVSGDDEEHGLTSNNMGFEASLIVQ